MRDKNFCKDQDHCHYTGEYWGGAHSICNLKYNYEYHFIIKELPEDL